MSPFRHGSSQGPKSGTLGPFPGGLFLHIATAWYCTSTAFQKQALLLHFGYVYKHKLAVYFNTDTRLFFEVMRESSNGHLYTGLLVGSSPSYPAHQMNSTARSLPNFRCSTACPLTYTGHKTMSMAGHENDCVHVKTYTSRLSKDN